MAKVQNTSRYGMLIAQNAKRRAIMEHGLARSDTIRNAIVTNINNRAGMMVQTTEMQLRTNAQAAAKAKLAALNKLSKLV